MRGKQVKPTPTRRPVKSPVADDGWRWSGWRRTYQCLKGDDGRRSDGRPRRQSALTAKRGWPRPPSSPQAGDGEARPAEPCDAPPDGALHVDVAAARPPRVAHRPRLGDGLSLRPPEHTVCAAPSRRPRRAPASPSLRESPPRFIHRVSQTALACALLEAPQSLGCLRDASPATWKAPSTLASEATSGMMDAYSHMYGECTCIERRSTSQTPFSARPR